MLIIIQQHTRLLSVYLKNVHNSEKKNLIRIARLKGNKWDNWIRIQRTKFVDKRISACIIIIFTCTLASVRLIFMARSSLVKTSG